MQPQACNFIENRLKHRYFPVTITKFLRKPTLKNIWQRLLLNYGVLVNKILLTPPIHFSSFVFLCICGNSIDVSSASYWWASHPFSEMLQSWRSLHFRSNPPEVFLWKGFLKICSKCTGEHRCRSLTQDPGLMTPGLTLRTLDPGPG